METVVEMLQYAELTHGPKTAAEELDSGRTSSFAEMMGAAKRIASGLYARGSEKGDRAVVLLQNSIEFLEVELALATGGFLKAALPYGAPIDDLRRLLEFIEPQVAFVETAEFDRLADVFAEIGSLRTIVVRGGAATAKAKVEAKAKTPTIVDFADLRLSASLPMPAVTGDDPFILRFTSGTTDRPKAVLHDQRGFAAVVGNQLYPVNWGDYLREGDRFLQFLPLSAGTIFWFYSCFVGGATTVITDGFDPTETTAKLEKSGATCTFLVPPMLNAMVSAAGGLKRAPQLRTVFVGGTPMSSTQLAAAAEIFGEVFVFYYGASEYPVCTITTRRGERPAESEGRGTASCGRPALGSRIMIVDDDDQPVPARTVGSLLVRGQHAFREYWRNEAATSRNKLPGGWVRTDDMAFIDEDGSVFLVDRKDNVIKVGDELVIPSDVEEILVGIKGVAEVAVIGRLRSDGSGSDPVAVVVNDGTPLDEQSLLADVTPRLRPHEVPVAVVFRTEPLPRTPLGKVKRHEVAQYVKETLG